MRYGTPACFVVDPRLGLYEQTIQVNIDNRTYGMSLVGDGKPLVCFHGFSQTGHTWDTAYIPGYQMVRIDWLGHGRSSVPEEMEPYGINAMLADVHCLLQAYVGSSYDLMGYSMGGRLALLYSMTYPEAVTSLILESSSCGIADKSERQCRREQDDKLAQTLLDHDGPWFATRWAEAPIFASQKNLLPEVQHIIWRRRAHNSMRGLANTLRMSGQGMMPFVGDNIAHLSMRTLYISGALDETYTAIGNRYFAPHMPMVTIPCAGHTVHLEQPKAFTNTVLRFLTSL